MAQQSPDNACAPAAEIEFSQQITENIVIIAGVKSDIVTPSTLDYGANHIESLIAVKRRDFDGDNISNFGELSPELIRQYTPANSWL
jgi:hypothetical protein